MNIETIKVVRDTVADVLSKLDVVLAQSGEPSVQKQKDGAARVIEAWVMAEPARLRRFRFDDFPPGLKLSRSRTSKALANMVARGRIERIGYGIYRWVGGGETGAVKRLGPDVLTRLIREGEKEKLREAEEVVAKAKAVERVAEAPRFNLPKLGRGPMADVAAVAREVLSRNGGVKMSAGRLWEECVKVLPVLAAKRNGEMNFRVRLVDAAASGLLTRSGVGSGAVYSVGNTALCHPAEGAGGARGNQSKNL